MLLSMQSFRCFNESQGAKISPLTILTGENSAGKTSFLAAARIMSEMMSRSISPSFNKDPFSLGSFSQISHYRGGRAGRSKYFSFKVEGAQPWARTKIRSSYEGSLEIVFENSRSQAVVSSLIYKNNKDGIEIRFLENESVSINVIHKGKENSIEILLPEDDSIIDRRFVFTNLSSVPHVIRDLVFEYDLSDAEEEILKKVSEAFSRYLQAMPQNVMAGAPVRSRPRRTYDPSESPYSSEGDHVPDALSRIKLSDSDGWQNLVRSMNEFGKLSGLFSEIDVKNLGNAEGDPFQIYLKIAGPKSNIVDVGYGVSQVLPIIFDIMSSRPRSIFILQQPEVHLHPKAQAALGEFLLRAAIYRKQIILVETHSDHLVDRARRVIKEDDSIGGDNISLLYFKREGIDSKIHKVEVSDSGRIVASPPGYREFFANEAISNLGL